MDYIIIAIIVGLAILSTYAYQKRKKGGKGCCGGNCNACSGCSAKH